MVEVLADPSLYHYTGGEAPTLARLQRRYKAQVLGHSPDGSQGWFNWIVHRRDGDAPIGFVQATLQQNPGVLVAEIAWLISPTDQGNGFASEATTAMTSWLLSIGVGSFVAHVRPEHLASIGVARNQGLHPTPTIVDGEIRWES